MKDDFKPMWHGVLVVCMAAELSQGAEAIKGVES